MPRLHGTGHECKKVPIYYTQNQCYEAERADQNYASQWIDKSFHVPIGGVLGGQV